MTRFPAMAKFSAWAGLLLAGGLAVALCGCEGASVEGPVTSANVGAANALDPTGSLAAKTPAHKLSQGEKIRVAVFNEQQLSGEFEIDGLGNIPMPLIGLVQAAGRTPAELEGAITKQLKGRYLVDPKVSVEVMNALPVYVIGEVKSAGAIPYKPGLTVVSVVALAGGYTPRADSSYVQMQRNGRKENVSVASNAQLLPGDVIAVPERYF